MTALAIISPTPEDFAVYFVFDINKGSYTCYHFI